MYFTLVALPGLIDTLAQLLARKSLLWLTLIWRRRFLTQSNFLSTAQHRWSVYLTVRWSFCSSQEKPLRWTEINTHRAGIKIIQVKRKHGIRILKKTWWIKVIQYALKSWVTAALKKKSELKQFYVAINNHDDFIKKEL